ncbi:Phosphatidylglycerophosphate phosphatase 1, chloroplastic/mitochondrial [Datura stramonium]|uniref:Phosphatidylglycerophosphate phosphatase 1, chloroplastic/mitochondrial n=1 Tax=Datura stramonium TaxID=4076 RepID=A0ABS8TJP2_DATST|nr:Phosphatidylglycerophosphate phosphatase 1, chloroplastic/mitochondrial [Datura stramonium]
MQSTSITPLHTCCCFFYPIPSHFHSHRSLNLNKKKTLTLSLRTSTHFTSKCCCFTLSSTHSCSKEQEKSKGDNNYSVDPDRQNPINWEEFYSSIQEERTHYKEDPEFELPDHLGIRTNMWWTDLKAALGQRINVEGIVSSLGVFSKDKHLAIPHVSVPDIRYIDWAELKKRGFEGVVFDKDNTITVPYSLSLWSPLASSIDQCKSLFGNNIAVYSNSAGLDEYDSDGRKARILERAIGIKVIKHRVKKPAGTAEEIEKQFGCESSRLIMVGDRPFTDIVYGNRNGFLTILTEPLSCAEEPLIVQQVRVLEVAIVNRWCSQGMKPTTHTLLPDCQQCVKDDLL